MLNIQRRILRKEAQKAQGRTEQQKREAAKVFNHG